jgi:gamma-glutamyltranspeptidase
VAMVLKLLEPFDLGIMPMNTRALHLIADAKKTRISDRDCYATDTDLMPMLHGASEASGSIRKEPSQAVTQAHFPAAIEGRLAAM